ncbi:hypothetical protein [Nonomuraea fuscirosea]|uniref:hypothetical protein n=1 Tax=Nonomuraea fuscirosea TaxID=1291556 RepID=UPI0033DB7B3E
MAGRKVVRPVHKAGVEPFAKEEPLISTQEKMPINAEAWADGHGPRVLSSMVYEWPLNLSR